MEDKDYQKRNLEKIYGEASLAPVFKQNSKYCVNRYSDLIAYISYNDVMSNLYKIRMRPVDSHNSFDSEEREVIVEYGSIGELVNDGWRLD